MQTCRVPTFSSASLWHRNETPSRFPVPLQHSRLTWAVEINLCAYFCRSSLCVCSATDVCLKAAITEPVEPLFFETFCCINLLLPTFFQLESIRMFSVMFFSLYEICLEIFVYFCETARQPWTNHSPLMICSFIISMLNTCMCVYIYRWESQRERDH
jgi:hypothetical protein